MFNSSYTTKERCIKRGEIYWISSNPYKETLGDVQRPNRPAIIVSNNAGNTFSYTFEVVYLTTAPKKDLPTHATIRSTDQVSTALCEQITTISDEQIGSYIGRCTDNEMAAIDTCLLISLGLDEEKATDEDRPTMDNAESAEKSSDIAKLEAELALARKGEELYRQMYDDLLNRVMSR